MQDLDWDDLRYVLVLSRSGKLARAAGRLRVNETTVARHIARIEKRLATRLFERVDGGLVLTEAGHLVVQHAERIEVDVSDILNAATGADAEVSGRVRLTAVPMVLNRILVPALPSLLAAHPRLEMQLVADPRNLNLIHREADVALRLARPEKDVRAIARRIGDVAYAAYGPKRGRSQSLPWITYEDHLSALPHVRWMSDAMKKDPRTQAHIFVNDSDVAVHAIQTGLGRSLLPCCVGDYETGLKKLGNTDFARELWLLVHPDLKHLARIRVVIDWIDKVMGERLGRSDAQKAASHRDM